MGEADREGFRKSPLARGRCQVSNLQGRAGSPSAETAAGTESRGKHTHTRQDGKREGRTRGEEESRGGAGFRRGGVSRRVTGHWAWCAAGLQRELEKGVARRGQKEEQEEEDHTRIT